MKTLLPLLVLLYPTAVRADVQIPPASVQTLVVKSDSAATQPSTRPTAAGTELTVPTGTPVVVTTPYGQVVVPNNTVAVWVMFLVTAIPVAFAIWTKLEERKTKQRNQELHNQNVELALKVPPTVPGGRRASDPPAAGEAGVPVPAPKPPPTFPAGVFGNTNSATFSSSGSASITVTNIPPPTDPLKTLPVFRQRTDEGLKP